MPKVKYTANGNYIVSNSGTILQILAKYSKNYDIILEDNQQSEDSSMATAPTNTITVNTGSPFYTFRPCYTFNKVSIQNFKVYLINFTHQFSLWSLRPLITILSNWSLCRKEEKRE